MAKKTRKLTQLQIDELASFGYMVRSNDERECTGYRCHP